jgi:hypothetical protein
VILYSSRVFFFQAIIFSLVLGFQGWGCFLFFGLNLVVGFDCFNDFVVVVGIMP